MCSPLRLWQGSAVVVVQTEGLEHAAQPSLVEAARGGSSLTCCRGPPGLSVSICQMGVKNPEGFS